MTIVCSRGCCPGCGDCYGYAIGCHRDPCRCDRPCSCTEDDWGDYHGPCDRHYPAVARQPKGEREP